MEYDQDEKQSKRDIRNGRIVVLCIIVAFCLAGLVIGKY